MDNVSPLIETTLAETLAKQRGFECEVIADRLCIFRSGEVAPVGMTIVEDTNGVPRVSRHSVEKIIGVTK